jgi:hypothetical protein
MIQCNVADTDISQEHAAVVIKVEESGTSLPVYMVLSQKALAFLVHTMRIQNLT